MEYKNKRDILEKIISRRFIVFDGGMGTSLQKVDLSGISFPNDRRLNEYLSIQSPDIIKNIHDGFIQAGADIIETNTFSANGISLSTYGLEDRTYDLNYASVSIAREVAESYDRDIFIAGSIGPSDKMPLLDNIGFDDMVKGYIPQADGLLEAKADILLLETFQDPLGLKAGLFAVQKMMEKHCYYPPVMVSVSFSENGLMLFGTEASAILNVLEAYPLFSVGINCSLGPLGLKNPLRYLTRHYEGYISFMPNAGMPKKINGKLSYDMGPDEFGTIMADLASELNIDILGGCCGTDDDYIGKLSKNLSKLEKRKRDIHVNKGVASLYKAFDYRQVPPPFIIGERTNVSGSRKFAGIVKTGDINNIINFCKEYSVSGMHAIDLFLKKGKKVSEELISEIIKKLSKVLAVNLCFDCKDMRTIEKALKLYPGRMIINSSSLKDGPEKLLEYFQMVKLFGASIILLAIDEKGMAIKMEDKLKIFSKMIDLARENGLHDSQIILDPLTFSIVSGESEYSYSVKESLEAIRALKREYSEIPVIMGVSNVSFGVKEELRKIINSVFLFEATHCGLDMAIINAEEIIPMNQIDQKTIVLVKDLLYNKDGKGYECLKELLSASYEKIFSDIKPDKELSEEDRVYQAILRGNSHKIKDSIINLIKKGRATDYIINDLLIMAISEVGRLFKEGFIPLPYVLESAQAMKEAFSVLREYLPKVSLDNDKKFILATVRGDIHDIGKNLVDIIVKSHGYHVINLGIEVDIATIIDNIKGDNYYIGLSGLINESLGVIEEYIREISRAFDNIPVIVGGAAVSKEFVDNNLKNKYDRVYYGKDPFDAVRLLEGKLKDEKREAKKPYKNKDRSINRYDINFIFPNKDAIHTIMADPRHIIPMLDREKLIKARWKYSIIDEFDKKNLQIELDRYIADILDNSILKPIANYSYSSVIRENDHLRILQNNKRIFFERELFSFIDYFKKEEEDTIILYCLSIGNKAKEYKNKYYEEGKYKDYHLINGLISEIVESFLKYLSRHILNEAGLDKISNISPLRLAYGYPYCPKLKEQVKVADILKIHDIGISFTELYQLNPEESSSGFILPFIMKK